MGKQQKYINPVYASESYYGFFSFYKFSSSGRTHTEIKEFKPILFLKNLFSNFRLIRWNCILNMHTSKMFLNSNITSPYEAFSEQSQLPLKS